jgi:hypothetical protein
MTMVLSIVAAGTVPVALRAQSLLPVPDSILIRKPSTISGLDLSRSNYTDFLKNIGSYKLNLSNGFSLKTQGISTVNALNPNNFRRPNVLSREDLLYGQHFSFGASYNGLNNMLRGGYGGTNGRNPGLSLHAGISF